LNIILEIGGIKNENNDMKTTIYTVYGQIYLLPYIKLTHTRHLNGDLEFIIGWIKWEIVFGV